ncbi:unnamed protein product [Paramecium octaurelia]|uniref:Uncharacterized protein n=1 Tax=Paramecium octaurelia TaxID=43137 RepID=A0A8S1RV22_PAROT|nr:unnamed protein product [Paramecium octaurelia]
MNFTKIVFNFAKQNFRIVEAEKLIFDKTNKSLIYRLHNGENQLQWCLRGLSFFTALNCILASQEYIQPIFGGWNCASYTLCTVVGFAGLMFLKIFSKRTIHEVRLLKTGDFVEIKYFNAFWTPRIQTVHVSEFANLTESYFSYHRVDLTSVGKVWINIEKNEFAEQFQDQSVLMQILSGVPIKLDQSKHIKKQIV